MVSPSPSFRRKMLQRAEDIRAEAENECALVLDHARERLPDLADHPAFPRLIEAWWRPIALDLPPEWTVELPLRCKEFFSTSGWGLPQFGDGVRRNVSIERCRKLLGDNAHTCDERSITFLREQLYSLAEVVADRLSTEPEDQS